MNRPIGFLAVGLLITGCFAQSSPAPQSTAPTPGNAGASMPQAPARAGFPPGAVIRVQLDKSIDAKKAKVGDPVVAKTMDDIGSHEHIVAPKGSKVIAHLAEVASRQGDSTSMLGVSFDKLVLRDGSELPLKATIQAIGKPQSYAAPNAEPSGGYGSAPTGSPMGSNARGSMGASKPRPGEDVSSGGSGIPNESAPGAGDLSPNAQGVVGMPGMSLGAGTAQDSVISSEKHNVKLDSGTQMILRTQ